MNKDASKLRFQVFFQDPFWIGVFERIQDEKLSVSKVTFGSEPKDCEIWLYVVNNFDKLKFSPAIEFGRKEKNKVNPKRLKRQVKRQTVDVGIGTKSQQALKLWQEQRKVERRFEKRSDKEERQAHLFKLKQQKKREKHKGR